MSRRFWLTCLACACAPALAGADRSVPATFFYQGDLNSRREISLPVDESGALRLLNRRASYRNDRKACVEIALPGAMRDPEADLSLSLEAYNDDGGNLRAVWFEVDGVVGGYLAAHQSGGGRNRGEDVIGTHEHKRWRLPLDRVPISVKGRPSAEIDFRAMLQAKGAHTVCSWNSTYGRYGPGSWITLDLTPAFTSKAQVSASYAAPPAPAFDGPEETSADCSGRALALPERGLLLEIESRPERPVRDGAPVCDRLRVSRLIDGGRETVRLSPLNFKEAEVAGAAKDYRFLPMSPQGNAVLLVTSDAFRVYRMDTDELSLAVSSPSCKYDGERTGSLEFVSLMEAGRYVYGNAFSCVPFLKYTAKPLGDFSFAEVIGSYMAFVPRAEDRSKLMAVVDPERGLVHRFPRPADNQYRYALAYHLNGLGIQAYNREDFPEAAELFRRAAAVTPSYYAYPHINLVGALALTGQRAKALSHLHTACEIDPSLTSYAMMVDPDFASIRRLPEFKAIKHGPCSKRTARRR